MVARQRETSFSRLTARLLDRALSKIERQKLDVIYQVMEQAKGVSQIKRSDASVSIDELLYGEEGVWRGSDPPDTNVE